MQSTHPAAPELAIARWFNTAGNPTLVVIDRAGRIRLNAFGQVDDLTVGATLARLIDEPRPQPAD